MLFGMYIPRPHSVVARARQQENIPNIPSSFSRSVAIAHAAQLWPRQQNGPSGRWPRRLVFER